MQTKLENVETSPSFEFLNILNLNNTVVLLLGNSKRIVKLEYSTGKFTFNTALHIISLVRLPFYHGNGPTAITLIKLGNRLGWKSSTAYIMRKK